MPSSFTNLLTVILAFRYPVFADDIWKIIKDWKGIDSISIVNDKKQFLLRLHNTPATLVFLDDNFPGLESLMEIKNLMIENHLARFVIFYDDNTQHTCLKTLLFLRAFGYIARQSPVDKIKAALSQLISGNSFIENSLSDILYNNVHPSGIKLAPREYDVYHLLEKGHTVSYICETLNITKNTYKGYRKNIDTKIKANGFTGLKDYLKNKHRKR